MSAMEIISLTKEGLFLVLILSLPPIVVASVLGVGLSLVQAITQVQEQTLSFAVKLLGVVCTLALTAAWLGRELILYTGKLFDAVMRLGVY